MAENQTEIGNVNQLKCPFCEHVAGAPATLRIHIGMHSKEELNATNPLKEEEKPKKKKAK